MRPFFAHFLIITNTNSGGVAMAKHRKKKYNCKTNQQMWEQMGGEGECQVATNVHHRRSKRTGGGNNAENLSRVPIKAHHEYNRLFRDGHMHPTEMAKMLTDTWIDPDWELIARKKGERPCPKQLSSAPAVKSVVSESGLSPQPHSATELTVAKLVHLLELALTALQPKTAY